MEQLSFIYFAKHDPNKIFFRLNDYLNERITMED